MMLETLLSATLETRIGLVAEAGLVDALHDLNDRLTRASERRRRQAFERAFAHARETVVRSIRRHA